jgi:hypothetical protein
VNLPYVEDLSDHTAAEDGETSPNRYAGTSDEGSPLKDENMMMSNQVTRDALLLKCRDAIENLHLEIEEERA